MTVEEIINDYYEKLQHDDLDVEIDYCEPENSVDFIMDEDLVLEPRAIIFKIDDKCRIDVCFEKLKKSLFVKATFRSNVKDFTKPQGHTLEHPLVFEQVKGKCVRTDQVIDEILKNVRGYKEKVLELYRPSKELASLVGSRDMFRYEIIDLLSHCILNNNLLLPSGDIRVDSHLSSLFKDCGPVVDEDYFFKVLRKNIKKI